MKLKKELFWNYVSLIIMAVAGLLMNMLIIFFFDSSVLGMFNETYAWYMILSQMSVWGIHMAVLKFVPEQKEETEKKRILKCALYITAVISFWIIISIELLLFLLEDVAWRNSLRIAAAGLLFFSLNKVLLNYINALSEMVNYAIFQSLRYIMLIISILAVSLMELHYELLALAFPVTEIVIFITLFIYIYKRNQLNSIFDSNYIKRLIIFGTKILPSNMVLEVNTKVDVVCLGLLVNDTAQIGVYSFAILFAEGFYQLYITIRKIVDPKLAEWSVQRRIDEFIKLVWKNVKGYFVVGTMMAYSAVLIVYFIAYTIILPDEYKIGICYIALTCFAIGVNGKKIILGNILAQTGNPLEESKLNVITVISNVMFNMIFIGLWGTIGATIATVLSYFVYGMQLKKSVRKKLGINL